MTVNGIAPAAVTGFHIHAAPYGVDGPIIIDFGTSALTPTGSGFTFVATNVLVDGIHEAALLGGLTYVNVHTAEFPNGAVRAQLFSTGDAPDGAGTTATGTSQIFNMHNAIGGAGNDSFVGNQAVNVIRGGGGNDTIVGGPGNDTLQGENGDDAIAWNNGDGTDIIDGGLGADTVQVNGRIGGAPDLFSIAAGAVGRIDFDRTGTGPFSLDIGTVETLSTLGLAGDDTITVTNLATAPALTALRLAGFAGADSIDASLAGNHLASVVIDGGTGIDVLTGTAGIDSIRGGPDGDTLTGLAGNDAMTGGAGADAILGGGGADTMSGGPDADTFTWNPGDGSDIVDGDTGADHLVFNGSGASEVIGIAAVAARVQLTRDVASITMDIGTTEALSVIALGGNDSITVSSLAAATDLTTLLLSGDDGTDVITASAAGSHLASVTIQEVRGPTR